jgi:hypothetical protein
MPEKFQLIRPEFTMRPVLDEDNGELVGVEVIGVRENNNKNNIIDADRLLYLEHGFNNELFSDHYGDSKVGRVSDIANTLNIILNQDYERAAEFTWHQPKVFSVPIAPQDAGKEDEILDDFLRRNSEAKGQDIAVTGPSKADEPGVQLLSNTTNSGNITGLEVMRIGLVKAIITAFGLPGFMLSEGDIGKLGGNANIEEIDSYLQTEIRPEVLKLEATIQAQIYDQILMILFKVLDSKDVPVKMLHKYNKPKLATLLSPEMYQVLDDMVAKGRIDEGAMRDMLGLTELNKETTSKGGDITPGRSTWIQQPNNWRPNNPWQRPGWTVPQQDWVNQNLSNQWVNPEGVIDGRPKGWSQVDADTWVDPQGQRWNRAPTNPWTVKNKGPMGEWE